MESLTSLLQRVGPGGRMLLFLKTVCVSLLVAPAAPPAHVIVKCAPILALILIVMMHRKSLPVQWEKERKYCKRIAWALGFSVAGDAVLVSSHPSALPVGMLLFAVAHIVYCIAMGFKPFGLNKGLISCIIMTPGIFYLAPHNWLHIPVVVYCILLGATLWRSLVKGFPASLAALLFVLSDGTLAYTMFIDSLPHERFLVMSTYYSAQLLFALSAVKNASNEIKSR